ncbi:hypothetical protein [Chitinophaga rhizosphaerae]|uniref:hypothetical protein n=1 Tax=Chitinophaga rhizosphaerae TaxID=1864947 RepID=UPI000F7FC3B2|nr:hypothetical protein [Chitinophaga rhizosphaerae]
MNTFHIRYRSHDIPVSLEEENLFLVSLPWKSLYLVRKEDNEGATHWFEEGADNETQETKEIGTAIEMTGRATGS